MVGIYKILSPSGKVYIGQTWNSEKRFSNYRSLYCKTQVKLYNSLIKYGYLNHVIEIIHELPNDCEQRIMDNYENFYLQQYKSCGFDMMNLREAGSRGKHSEESKRKMSEVWDRFPFSKEKKAQIANSLREYYKNNSSNLNKAVIQITSDGKKIEWDSARLAERKLNIKASGISRAAKGKNKNNKYKDCIWKFKQ